MDGLFVKYGEWLFIQSLTSNKGRILMFRKLYQKIANRKHSKIVTLVNKMLIRCGVQPLFTSTRKQLRTYWINPPEEANRPKSYLEGQQKSEYLVNLIKRFGSEDDSILELGCNVGRNLFYLWQSGYKNISGIEINEQALDIMRVSFPDINHQSIYNGSFEDVIPEMESKKFDVIFSMAVLEHIHPKSNFIFKEMVRICKKYLITIEIEDSSSARVFPRNYQKIFEKLGCTMVYQENLKNRGIDLDSYTARVFQVE